jgi:RNA polymerase sigma-70 factor (sigma-E family)
VQREDGSSVSFDDFARVQIASLSRLAFLLTQDGEAADDLVADALLAAWRRWDVVCAADSPVAYVRGIVVKLAGTRVRKIVREREQMRLLAAVRSDATSGPDVSAVLDVRAALGRLPRGQRVCAILRYGMGMSESDVAATLGVSVGTVKSQTSKAAARLRAELGAQPWGR